MPSWPSASTCPRRPACAGCSAWSGKASSPATAREVDPERVGLGLQAFVRVQLSRHDADAIAAFAAFVNGWDEVVACHALTGDMDYLLQIVVQDLEHFSRFLLDRLLNQAGVADVNSSFVLRTVKASGGVPLPAR